MLGDAAFVGFIPVKNLDSARRFYCDSLGLRLIEQNSFALVVEGGGATIRVTEVNELTPQAFTVAGWQVNDIAAVIAALIKAGIEMKRYQGMPQDELGVWVTPGGDSVAWFEDPDGNILSITELGR